VPPSPTAAVSARNTGGTHDEQRLRR
jgi:hypothetical protein